MEQFRAQSLLFHGDRLERGLYTRIAEKLAALKHENVLFYLATQPSYYETVVEGLGPAKLAEQSGGWRRVVIEKPFGHDLASARLLNQAVHRVLAEEQVYRIDHYLGKETVQNILAFRFGNGIFEPLWNRRFVSHVQITAAESIGVEGRGAYYQEAGALRDMIQSHLLQVTATIAMEPPATFDPDTVAAMNGPSFCDRSASRAPRRWPRGLSPASIAGFARSRTSIRTRAPRPTRP